MKIMKNVIYVVLLSVIALFVCATGAKATTVKVTADTLNLRKEASTSSNILVMLDKGAECELIEESGDWYKIKYKTYTGFVSKEYVKINETVDDSSIDKDNNDVDNEETDNNKIDTDSEDATQVIDQENIVTGKLAKTTKARLLPLISSSVIDNLKQNTEVTIIAELNGWSYISTDKISAWIRSDSIKGKKTVDNTDKTISSNKNQPDKTDDNKKEENEASKNDTSTEKVMYINDSYVNLRKGPSTSSDIVMVVALNTKLTVIGEEGDWYKVKTSVGNAYVSKELLSDKQKEVTSRGGSIIRGATENISGENLKNPDKNVNNQTINSTSSTKPDTNTSSTKGNEIVSYAKKFLKVPYVYGGARPSGFDCSGFTMYVYKKFGINMAHSAQAQAKLGTAVKTNKNSASSLKQDLEPGDLVFFLDYETMDEIGHCGIYIGDGNFIHASSGSGYCVKINSLLPGDHYNTRYCAARRVI